MKPSRTYFTLPFSKTNFLQFPASLFFSSHLRMQFNFLPRISDPNALLVFSLSPAIFERIQSLQSLALKIFFCTVTQNHHTCLVLSSLMLVFIAFIFIHPTLFLAILASLANPPPPNLARHLPCHVSSNSAIVYPKVDAPVFFFLLPKALSFPVITHMTPLSVLCI